MGDQREAVMRQAVWRVVIAALAMLVSVGVEAVERDSPSEISRRLSEAERSRINGQAVVPSLSGWNGLVFACSAYVSDDSVRAEICQQVIANAKFLAATARVPIVIAPDTDQLNALAASGGRLKLVVAAVGVGCDKTHSCALNATVTASFRYKEVVDRRAQAYVRLNGRGSTSDVIAPASLPRNATVEFWRQGYLAVGDNAGSATIRKLTDGIDLVLKEFFTDYLAANPGL